MLDYNLLKTKTRCLQIYFLISESSETARDAIASIETRGINSENILITCNKTLDFAHKITSQLINYTKDVEDYILEINKSLNNDVKNVHIKKEKSPRKSILSLKKEQNEESTQDEFLEIYKIDMTEDLSTPYQKTSKFETILEKDATSSDDNSKQTVLQLDENELNCPKIEDKNDDNLLEKVSNGSVNSLNEDDILKNIGCDTSDIESDCDTLFSGSTFVLEENLDMSKKLEDLNEFLSPDRNKEVDDNANINEENNFNLMKCSVVLSKCDMEKTVPTEENNVDKEMRQIENLINLDNLKRKHSAEHTKPNKRRKKEKIKDKDSSHSTDALSDSSATCGTFSISAEQDDIDKQESLGNTHEKAAKERDEFLNGLLNCISDASDVLEDVSEGDHSGSDVGSTKNKKTANNEKVIIEDKIDSNQENDTENDVSVEIIENDALDGKKNEKKKWRQDKLLTAKIASDSSDCEKENDPEHRQKRKKRRKVRRKSASDFLSVQQPTSSESEHLSGSEFEDIGSDTYISSDSTSSEVEFVKSFTKESSTKNDEQGKVGRRNIRSVRSDALLGATTKKAQREEEERLDRLEPRTQLLSQLAEESGLVLDFDKETKESLITVDQNITTRLKHHQKEGLRFMWNSCYESVETLKKSQGTGCILAHCMGLGKTFQVTSLINTLFAHDITNTKHVLILCPLSTVLNWEDEFKICYMTSKHKKRVKRYLITDGKSKDERYRIVSNWYKNNGVLIMGYDSFQSLLNRAVPKKIVEALLDPGPDLVVCDEGHMIKNGARNRTKTLTRIKTKRRIILTGTPMQNNLTEYYYMVDFVKPNLLGTKTEFSNRFINPIVNGGYDDSTETDIKIMRQRSHVLHEYLKHTIQRFEITELQSYLPEKIDYVLFIRMHELQIELYKAYLEIVSAAESDKKNRKFFIDYMRLKDLWTHPCILRLKEQSKSSQQNKRKEVDTVIVEPEIQEDMPNEWWHSKCPDDVMTNIEYGPKMSVMLEIVEHSVRLGDKVLIFGSYLAELDAIECFLNTNGWRKNVSYLRMDGTVPPDVRTSFCKKFNNKNEDRIKLFVLSHQVGGLGLNLIAANRIILMDVNFNPAIDSQSIFRTYRFGQEKRCYVYRLVSMGTMEEVVYERSVTKQAVSLRVVDEHQISRHYKSNDLQKMYRFNIYTDAERPVLKLPADEILATILEKCKKEIFKYHEHEDLLENRPEEQLNTEEQKLAWDEFRREQENAYQNQVTATNLQMQNAALLNQGVFPPNQIIASTSQPSTSSIPLQSQAVPTSTIAPQTTAFASIRLQNFANIANMNQQQYIVGLSSAINAKNSVNIRLPNNGVMGVPLIRQQIPKTRQDIASRSIVPNITILPNGKYQSASSSQRMPNILSRGSKILHPSTSTTRQQNATVIPTATTSNARSESARIRNLSEPSNEVPTTSSAYNNLPQLLPLTLVNVENNTSERWSTQMSNKTSDQNKKLQQADPLATKNKTEITSTSGLVITVGNPNNSNESSKQQVVQKNTTQPNNTGWPKSKVHAQNAPAKADATIETRMANNGVDCIIELD